MTQTSATRRCGSTRRGGSWGTPRRSATSTTSRSTSSCSRRSSASTGWGRTSTTRTPTGSCATRTCSGRSSRGSRATWATTTSPSCSSARRSPRRRRSASPRSTRSSTASAVAGSSPACRSGSGPTRTSSYSVTPIEQRERWREAIDFLIKAWTAKEFFAWNGKHYQYRKVNLWPRPIQDPHPPLIIPGAASSSTWDYCHARDIPYAYLSYFGGKSSQAVMDRFWDRAEENGHDRNPYRGGVPPARRRRRHRRAGRGAVRRARRVLLQEAAALPAAVPRARPATATTRAC